MDKIQKKTNSLGVIPTQKLKNPENKPQLNAPKGEISFLSQVQCAAKVLKMRHIDRNLWEHLILVLKLLLVKEGLFAVSSHQPRYCFCYDPCIPKVLPSPSSMYLQKGGMGKSCLDVWLLTAEFPSLRISPKLLN